MQPCTCDNHTTINAPRKKFLSATLWRDPTRTLSLRRSFEADVKRRFNKLKRAIIQAVAMDDIFGLKSRSPVTLNQDLGPRQFEFMRSDAKVKAFMDWLKEMERKHILTTTTGFGVVGEQLWTNTYIQSSYQRGMSRARQELKRMGYDVPEAQGFIPGGQDPVVAAFNAPFHADRVALAYTRTFSELQGITAVMDQQISRVLAQGLAEGISPYQIARNIVDRVDKIGVTRARMLARTEVVSAHHQATINEYEQWGVKGVHVMAEWLTAGFGVCPVCLSLAAKSPYTLQEIRGLIPVHPNCRCTTIPVLKEK